MPPFVFELGHVISFGQTNVGTRVEGPSKLPDKRYDTGRDEKSEPTRHFITFTISENVGNLTVRHTFMMLKLRMSFG